VARPFLDPQKGTRMTSPLKFQVGLAPGLLKGPTEGRLFVIAASPAQREQPYEGMTETGVDRPPFFAKDVRLEEGNTATIDGPSIAFPIAGLADLPPGEYRVQAVFDFNPDLRSPKAPGNLVSKAVTTRLDPTKDEAVTLTLDQALPAEAPPRDTDSVKYLKLESKLLSAFHNRPIYLRAAVVLPSGFDREPQRRYPLRVHVGGFGARYSYAPRPNADDSAPKFLTLVLDGAGPLGDPYQVNSANHGPYGDAITTELIPHVEKTYRGIGTGRSRVIDGGSTGGWVSLALQVFYPDFFNGCWSFCPDAVDFRDFQLVNIYEDQSAYVNAHGFDRPACRDRNGDVRYTMRHELGLENALGRGDSWTMSGGQWGSWNATYSPRGPDGRPMPLWDPKTGKIDRAVARQWEKYDLRLVLERDWKELGPKLRGKVHIWVGEADDFFLNNAVHKLDTFLKKADPPAEATVVFGPGQGHCWQGISERVMLEQMARAVQAR
jgi:S-formylglutathione hydrolase FrmB